MNRSQNTQPFSFQEMDGTFDEKTQFLIKIADQLSAITTLQIRYCNVLNADNPDGAIGTFQVVHPIPFKKLDGEPMTAERIEEIKKEIEQVKGVGSKAKYQASNKEIQDAWRKLIPLAEYPSIKSSHFTKFTCPRCGEESVSKHRTPKYCSHSCRSLALWERKKQAIAEPSPIPENVI